MQKTQHFEFLSCIHDRERKKTNKSSPVYQTITITATKTKKKQKKRSEKDD